MKACHTFAMDTLLLAMMLVIILPCAVLGSEHLPQTDLDFGEAAVRRGEAVFVASCQTCHSMKYFSYAARMTAVNATSAFGRTPPDLSLMTKARGGGGKGARFIYALLTGFNATPEKNALVPNIAMPPPFANDDPELAQKARDVAAFLFYAADPSGDERRRLGGYVIGYMLVLTALLYLVHRKTWQRLRKNSPTRNDGNTL